MVLGNVEELSGEVVRHLDALVSFVLPELLVIRRRGLGRVAILFEAEQLLFVLDQLGYVLLSAAQRCVAHTRRVIRPILAAIAPVELLLRSCVVAATRSLLARADGRIAREKAGCENSVRIQQFRCALVKRGVLNQARICSREQWSHKRAVGAHANENLWRGCRLLGGRIQAVGEMVLQRAQSARHATVEAASSANAAMCRKKRHVGRLARGFGSLLHAGGAEVLGAEQCRPTVRFSRGQKSSTCTSLLAGLPLFKFGVSHRFSR